MNLRQNQITIGEMLSTPGCRALLQRRFPFVFKKDFPPAAKTVTLEQLLALVGGFLPPRLLRDTLQELERL